MEENYFCEEGIWYRSVPIPGYVWKKKEDDFVLIGYNQAGEKITGGEVKNIKGILLSVLYADQSGIIEDIHKALSENTDIKKEMWYYFKKTQTKRFLVIQYIPVSQDHVIIYTEDHTEKKNAEKKIFKINQWLSEAQNTAGLGYWSFDFENGQYYWSDQMYRIFDMNPGEVEAGAENFYQILLEEDRPRFQANLESAMTKGYVEDIDLSIKTKYGNIRRIRTKTNLFPSPDGTFIPDFGIVWDITENYENILALEVARDEAMKANEAKTQFISRMSHELRTPLNAIIGFSELLKLNLSNGMSGTDKENADEIYEAGVHLLGLINDILDISRVDAGKVAFHFQEVNAVDILQNCITLLKNQMDNQNVRLINEIQESSILVKTDPLRIKQIFLNILSNAVKFNSSPGEIRLQVINSDDGVKAGIVFEDTGSGIAEDDLEKIFNPFERLHVNHEIEGAGIGLGICKMLAGQMNCNITVSSNPGRGSRFTVYVPAVTEDRIMAE